MPSKPETDKLPTIWMRPSDQRIIAAKETALKEVNKVAVTTTGEIISHLAGQKTSNEELAAAIDSVATT